MTLACLALASACAAPSAPESENRAETMVPPQPVENEAAPAPTPTPSPPSAAPAGLVDDRTPVSEAPFAETSAQGAANVVQTYYGLIEAGRFEQARRLWSDGGRSSGMSEAEFAASFGRYREYHALVGAPGRIEGAAGSLYVEVPVEIYGRLRSGDSFRRTGTMTLRRANEVPGATAEQRRWRIYSSSLPPRSE